MEKNYSAIDSEKQQYIKRIIISLEKRKSDLERKANPFLIISGMDPKTFDLEFGRGPKTFDLDFGPGYFECDTDGF